MASFDVVNYSLRPNKSVERKVVFSGLQALSRVIDFAPYRYLGLGSLWFIDYLMAHRMLGISVMTSIERDEIGVRRAKFNRPLGCIDVVHGDSTTVLENFDLAERPSIVWFDYDSSVGGPVLQDLSLLVPNCAPNSIVIASISAKKDDLPEKDERDEPLSEEASLRRIAGDLVPTPLPAKRLRPKEYPKLLCEVLTNQMHSRAINSGRQLTFIKLFDLAYTDSTPMITVGGMLAAPEKAGEIQGLIADPGWEGIAEETISVPPLTSREKFALDQMMPSHESPGVDRVHEAGFALRADQIKAYHRYYRHYPIFAEFMW